MPDLMLAPDRKPVPSRIAKLLLSHECELVASGALVDKTHAGATALWLHAPSTQLDADAAESLLYRPMGDKELLHLVSRGTLPDTQPYQAVIEGKGGRVYAEKFLTGRKWVDSRPTTVVEFRVPASLVAALMELQHKPEDGVVSMGLGDKAGGGRPLLNKALASGSASWRIVKVKRPISGRGAPVVGGKPRGNGKRGSKRGSARGGKRGDEGERKADYQAEHATRVSRVARAQQILRKGTKK